MRPSVVPGAMVSAPAASSLCSTPRAAAERWPAPPAATRAAPAQAALAAVAALTERTYQHPEKTRAPQGALPIPAGWDWMLSADAESLKLAGRRLRHDLHPIDMPAAGPLA